MSNKDIIIEYSRRIWEDHDLDYIDQVFHKDAIIHSPLNVRSGTTTMRETIDKWLTAFPDLEINWLDFVAEGNKVVSRWRALGTHLGSFFETSPSHTDVSYSGVTFYTFEDGKVAEYWALVDMHNLLRQLEGYESVSEIIE